MNDPTGWRPTAALTRAVIVGLLAVGGAVVLQIPVLVVLGLPLVLLAAAGLLHRPTSEPSAVVRTARDTLREGATTPVGVEVTGHGVEHVVHAVTRPAYGVMKPASGIVSGLLVDEFPQVSAAAKRWGPVTVGDGAAGLTSAWGGFRWGPTGLHGSPVLVLPAPAAYDANASVPRPVGLVGAHRSTRVGDGTEYAGTRPFQVGDRLRRVNWRVSRRTREMYADTTHTEDDAGVLLVVDALAEFGTPGASSIDLAVRAAAALAEQHVHDGDRVGLRVIGGRGQVLAPGAGRRHLRRLLTILAGTVAGRVDGALRAGVRSGDVVVWLTPLLSLPLAAAVAATADRGLTVLVIDTLPANVEQDDELTTIAWRLRLLERDAVTRALAASGVPVVRWRGPGTLDEVLRRLARQPPRVRAR